MGKRGVERELTIAVKPHRTILAEVRISILSGIPKHPCNFPVATAFLSANSSLARVDWTVGLFQARVHYLSHPCGYLSHLRNVRSEKLGVAPRSERE